MCMFVYSTVYLCTFLVKSNFLILSWVVLLPAFFHVYINLLNRVLDLTTELGFLDFG